MSDFLDVILRPADEADRVDFFNQARLAFSPTAPLEETLREWHDRPINPEGRQGWVAVDRQTSERLGRYRHLQLSLFFQGVEFPLAGVGGVAVALEHRGQRVAQAMLDHAVRQFAQQHIPLSMLYPFQQGFYRRLGWAWVGSPVQYRVATRSLPNFSERRQVRPHSNDQSQALRQLYRQVAPLNNGWLHRPDWWWQEQVLKPCPGKEIYRYQDGEAMLGYVVLTFDRLEGAPHCKVAVVQEWVVATAAAYRGLLGFLASLRDQIDTIVWNMPAQDVFPHLLQEQRASPMLPAAGFEFGLHDMFGYLGSGFMWRLVDIKAALELRPIHILPGFAIALQVHDPILGEQCYRVECGDGKMQVAAMATATSHDVARFSIAALWIKLRIDQLTALFCGSVTAQTLHWAGELWAEGDLSLLTQWDAAWQATPPFCWDFF
jgi:predicted acetyltransferase